MTSAVLTRPRQAELGVALADDHPVVRGGLRALLSDVDGINVVAESTTARESLRDALRLEPDVLIMDLPLCGPSGVLTVQELLRSAPRVAMLVFTMSEDDESVFNAMRVGARGYLLKGAEQDDIVRAVRGVAAGEAIFGARIACRLADLMARQTPSDRYPFPELTSREREIVELIAQGMTNAMIASRLFLAPKTVRNNISAIMTKLNVTSRADAIARAQAAGLG